MAACATDAAQPVPWLSASDARDALDIVERACAPASQAELHAALVWLAHVTTGDKLRDPQTALASAKALADALGEFPAHAAVGSIKDWPLTDGGKWWPTENELRAEAEALAVGRMRLRDRLRAMREKAPPIGPRQDKPYGRTADFVNAVFDTRGPDHVRSWLTGLNCAFTDDTIFTTRLGVDRISAANGGLITKHGIKLKYCADVTRAFYDAMDRGKAFEADHGKKRKRRGGADA